MKSESKVKNIAGMLLSKNSIVLAALIFATTCTPVMAQNAKKKKKTFSESVESGFNNTISSLEKAGHKLGDAIGFEDRIELDADYVRVGTKKYMPVYDVNVYHGKDETTIRANCRNMFSKKYPSASILSVSIPQTDWKVSEVKNDDVLLGYVKTLHCYVLARSGNDGYINARFTYQCYKSLNSDYEPLNDKWPEWSNSDFLTRQTYGKILSK